MDKNEENSIDIVLKEFQEMYDKMQLPKHREATEAFLQATAEDLNSTYRDIYAENKTRTDQQD